MESHLKGDLTEAIVITELKRRGISVSMPFGDNERYDIILETEAGEFYSAQIKTGWMRDGAIDFNARTQHTNSQGNTFKPYEDDVDFFLVYCDEVEQIYLIWENEFNATISLRVKEPEVQQPWINWAEEFEFDKRWPPKPSSDKANPTLRSIPMREAVQALKETGSKVFHPADNRRRRLLVETDGRIFRIQVTPGRITDGRIRFQNSAANEIDYFLICSEELESLYVVPYLKYNSTISLRLEESEQPNRRTKYAADFELTSNWPPDPEMDPDEEYNPAISNAVSALRELSSEVRVSNDEDYRTLAVISPNSHRYRVRVEPGWQERGLIRFQQKGDNIDYYVIYSEDQDELYCVADDAFNVSFSLRIDDSVTEDPDINWAEDYLLEENWPPEDHENDPCE